MNHINLVLVKPQYEWNFGACARACANMGAKRLYAVRPECDPADGKTRQGAAGAQTQLLEMQLIDSLAELIAQHPQSVFIAMTARSGKNRPSVLLESLLGEIKTSNANSLNSIKEFFLVLGPEDDGLCTEDIEECHFTAKLPVYGEFTSLNLAHAAQLALFITQHFLNHQKINEDPQQPEEYLPVPFESHELLNRWLLSLGFNLSSPKVNAAKTLTKLFKKSLHTQKEKDILEKVIHQSIRRIEEGKEYA